MKNTYFTAMMWIIGLVILSSCKDEYNAFIEPHIDLKLENDVVNDMEGVYIENMGQAESFSFWPGDDSHDYSKRLDSETRNTGLPPNRDNNSFEYYYKSEGTYNMVVVASSYNELTDKFVSVVDSIIITVVGNLGNGVVSFAISNALAGYSPEGIIDDLAGKITIPLAYLNRPYQVSDKDYAELINRRPPLFTLYSDFAIASFEDNIVLKGDGNELYNINLLDPVTLGPVERIFTVTKGTNVKNYSVVALFYPDVIGISLLGQDLVAYSKNGNDPDPEYVKNMQLSKPDYKFFGGVFFGTTDMLKTAVPTFTISDNAKVYLKGTNTEIISGVTQVDFSVSPTVFDIWYSNLGHTVTSTMEVYAILF